MNQKERRLVSIFLSELDELQARLSKALLKGDLLTGDNILSNYSAIMQFYKTAIGPSNTKLAGLD